MQNKNEHTTRALQPITARWAAPTELFVEPVEKVHFRSQNSCIGHGNLL